MNSNVNLVEIFYFTDEFCKEFSKMVGTPVETKQWEKA